MPQVWLRETGDHAHGCLPVLLRVHELRRAAASEARRLLRVLLVRLGEVPADPNAAFLLHLAQSHNSFQAQEVNELLKQIGSTAGAALAASLLLAINGFAAIDIAREFRPDVVLLDIGLPDFNGDKVARQLKWQPVPARTRRAR